MKRFWKALLTLVLIVVLLAAAVLAFDRYGVIGAGSTRFLSVMGYGATNIPLVAGDFYCPEGDLMVVRFMPEALPAVGDGVLAYKFDANGQWPGIVTGVEDGAFEVLPPGYDQPAQVPKEGMLAVYVLRIPYLAWAIGQLQRPVVMAGALGLLLILYILFRAWPAPRPAYSKTLSKRDGEIETML